MPGRPKNNRKSQIYKQKMSDLVKGISPKEEKKEVKKEAKSEDKKEKSKESKTDKIKKAFKNE